MNEFWAHRENISESIAAAGFAHKNDISIPIDRLGAFIEGLNALIAKEASDVLCVVFGHIADGNLHLNYLAPKGSDLAQFKTAVKVLEKKVFNLIKDHEGSISAEHGIGLLKKKDLSFSRSTSEIEFMKGIKKIFDPKNTMNPGKIFDAVVGGVSHPS
jgi:FAD/FMN-containing dehydrogenase